MYGAIVQLSEKLHRLDIRGGRRRRGRRVENDEDFV
jgi:hypothetical protein